MDVPGSSVHVLLNRYARWPDSGAVGRLRDIMTLEVI